MFYIGCHLSTSGGFMGMGETALLLGANTFAFFTRNPRGGQAKDIDENDVKSFLELAKDNNFGPLVAHAPYTLNLCALEDYKREFALNTLKDDLRRILTCSLPQNQVK